MNKFLESFFPKEQEEVAALQSKSANVIDVFTRTINELETINIQNNNLKEKKSKIPCTCIYCNKPFTAQKTTAKYCSESCRNKFLHNKDHIKYYRRSSVENSLRSILWGCKARAKRMNREYDLTEEYVLELLKQQNGICAATGLALKPSAQRTVQDKDPFTISIDRIDSNKGYIIGNVQLVCSIYNGAKNSFTFEQVAIMCKNFIIKNNIKLDD
jgi:hypothetical protein